MLSFANPIDDMAALNDFFMLLLFGNIIYCPSCVEELKRNEYIGYIVQKTMSEALISLCRGNVYI